MPIQPVKSYFDGDRTVPFQYGPVTVTRPFANTSTLDTYAIERMTAFDVFPSQFAAGSRIAVRTSYTNLLTFSEQFDNGIWLTSGSTGIGVNTMANPADGLVTADSIADTDSGATAFFYQAVTVANDSAMRIFSIFLKPSNGVTGQIGIAYFGGTVVSAYVKIDWASGVITASGSVIATVYNAGNGWYRLTVRLANNSSGNTSCQVQIFPEASSSAGESTCFVWGAQLEAAAVAGPYISTTNLARTISSPDWWDTTAAAYSDGDTPDPFAFLCNESDPSTDSVSGDFLFKRTWARIPKTQTVPTTLAITKPAVPNQSSGTLTFQVQSATADVLSSGGPGAYYAGYLFSPLNVVSGSVVGTNTFYGPMKLGSGVTAALVTSGLFTLNYRGVATSNLNYNDSIATIQSALNGLSTVISDGLTFSGGVQQLTSNGALVLNISVGSTAFRVVINPAGLSPAGATTMFTTITGPTQQIIAIACIVTLPAHGFDITKVLALTSSAVPTASETVWILQPRASVTTSGQWSIIDANTIAYSIGITNNTLLSGLFGQLLRSYTPGADRVRCNLVTNFYLPGVTAGITTGADIPVPAPLTNDTDFLTAVLANTSGYLNYDASDLTEWIGPIFQQTQKQIDFADV